jgi:hypothetical protein
MAMVNGDFNNNFRLFLESLEDEKLLRELAGDLGLNKFDSATASSSELSNDARQSLSSQNFSGKSWSPRERAVFRVTNSVLRYMIENGDITRLIPDLKIFFNRSLDKLGIQPPPPAEKDKNSLTVDNDSPNTNQDGPAPIQRKL